MRVALLFIDGVGMGAPDAGVNPLVGAGWLLSQFADGTGEELPAGGSVYPVDPTFGVSGRPQSATNQAAMFTGEPAPRLMGRHVLGFPTPFLRTLIERASIVKRLVGAGLRAAFTNCYPAGYLDAIGLPRRESMKAEVSIPPRYARKLKPSAIPLAVSAAGLAMRTLDDARRGDGLTHDIDGARARERGLEVPARSAREAAEIFWRVSESEGSALSIFEHHLADEAGHAQDRAAAVEVLGGFDRFAREVIAQRPADAAVLICSDHGNVEDLSTRGHTLHRVPVLAFGAPELALADVADIGKEVMRLIGAVT